jgi:hypothetical protein
MKQSTEQERVERIDGMFDDSTRTKVEREVDSECENECLSVLLLRTVAPSPTRTRRQN